VQSLPPILFHFLGFNALLGILIGALTARVPAFATMGIPSFLWLVAGLFAFEMMAGMILDKHPSTLMTMPWRVGGLMLAFVCCYATLAILS
jgi:ABC-type xylose transport system permease subunit